MQGSQKDNWSSPNKQDIATAVSCVDSKDLLMKTPRVLVSGYREVNLEWCMKLFSLRKASIVPEGIMKNSHQQCYSAR